MLEYKVIKVSLVVDKLYKELGAIADELGIKKSFTCDKCGKEFVLPSDLLIHYQECKK